MVRVSDILQCIRRLAPAYMREEWDNTGLLCGDPAQSVTKVLVALDPFEAVCREAADWGAELLVTHHPLVFRPLKSVTTQTATGRAVLFLAAHGICAVNAHTDLDCAPGGVNDTLAEKLGLSDVRVLSPAGTDQAGREWGLLRAGTVAEQPVEAFLDTVKERLGTPVLRYVNAGKAVRLVAVGGGSCAGELETAAAAGCDTFVTADVKYNQFWSAQDLGINLIDAGHFYTENPVCTVLAGAIRREFPNLQVQISKVHGDCMKFR